MRRCSGRMTKPPAYPFRYLAMSNSRGTKQTAVANTTWRQQPARPEFPSAPFEAGTLSSETQAQGQELSRTPTRTAFPVPQSRRFRLPRPAQRPRRSVKRCLEAGDQESKRNLSKTFIQPQRNCHALVCAWFLYLLRSSACNCGIRIASRTATAARIASGFPGQIL